MLFTNNHPSIKKSLFNLKINVTQIFILRHFDKFKKTILKSNFFNYVNEKILL